MINLLPPENKREIRAARVNVMLVKLNIVNILTIGLLTIIVSFAYIVLNISRSNAESEVEKSKVQIASYEKTKAQAEEYKKNLALAKQIKDIQISYSDALIKIGQALPSEVTLNSLQLSPDSLGQPIEIQLTSNNYVNAIDIKNSLSKADLLEDVRFIELEGQSDTVITMSITIKKEVLQ